MRLRSAEMGGGFIEVLAIWEKDGKWEAEWEPLRTTVVGNQFSTCSQEDLDHALNGFSRPLTDALGIEPAGAIRKLPTALRDCHLRRKCPFFEPRNCHILAKSMPWCFEPDPLDTAEVRQCATKAIEQWREGVYLVVVQETTDAG